MKQGFLYLVAIMGWVNRKVRDEAFATHGVPKPFNKWLCLLQYAGGYPNAFEHLRTAAQGAGRWTAHHNGEWPHRAVLSACTGSTRVFRPMALAVLFMNPDFTLDSLLNRPGGRSRRGTIRRFWMMR